MLVLGGLGNGFRSVSTYLYGACIYKFIHVYRHICMHITPTQTDIDIHMHAFIFLSKAVLHICRCNT